MIIAPVDTLFSWAIRYRDKWKCQRCGLVYPEMKYEIDNSHYFGRGMRSVRFDLENCDAFCRICHLYFEKINREDYKAFKIKQLSEAGLDALTLRAHTICKSLKSDELERAKKLYNFYKNLYKEEPNGKRERNITESEINQL